MAFDETNIASDVIDIVPNRIARDFWVKRRIDNPGTMFAGTGTSRLILEYSTNRDDTTSNMSTVERSSLSYNDISFVSVSEDPRKNGYNPFGEFPISLDDKYLPDINWINRVTDDLDHVGNRMVLTPQLVRFNDDVFFISYANGIPILNSREFGKIKDLNENIRALIHGSSANYLNNLFHTEVESMFVQNNSLIVKMSDGVTYNFDKDLHYTITMTDRKYTHKTIDNSRMTSMFEGHQRVDLHDLDFKLLYYDEETSTGVGVEDKHDRIILINYNNRQLCDYKSKEFHDINRSLFSNVNTCSAFIKGNYLVIRDEILGFSIYTIVREENRFQLEQIIWADSEDQVYPGVKTSFIVFDGDVYIPNGKKIYRIQIRPYLDIEVYESRFTVKQLYDYNGILLALCQDPFIDEDGYIYDITFLSLFNVGYTNKDKAFLMQYYGENNDENEPVAAYQTGYTNLGDGSAITYLSNSFVGLDTDGPRTDMPLVLIPLVKYNSIELYAEGATAGFTFYIDHNTTFKTKFNKFSLVWGSDSIPELFRLNSELKTIAGYPYLIKNGAKIAIDALISQADRRSPISMSADVESIKKSKNANFISDMKDGTNEDVVSSILSQKDGFVRNFDTDNIYMVARGLGDKFVVYDKYTDRKRIDKAVEDSKTISTFQIIETDRYLIRVARDIDPKISMYMTQLKDDELNRLCSSISADKFR